MIRLTFFAFNIFCKILVELLFFYGKNDIIILVQNNGEDILPGWSDTLNFSIVNTSTEDNLYANYTLAWEIEENYINDANFVYTLECTSVKDGKEINESEKNTLVKVSSPRKVPTVSTNIGTGMINTGVTHNCELKLMLTESGVSQDFLQGKSFKGKIVAKGDPNL